MAIKKKLAEKDLIIQAERKYVEGVIAALTEYNRLYGNPEGCAEVMRSLGVTVEDVRDADLPQAEIIRLKTILHIPLTRIRRR